MKNSQFNNRTGSWEPAKPVGLRCITCGKEHTNGMSDFCSLPHKMLFVAFGNHETERLCKWYMVPVRFLMFLFFVVLGIPLILLRKIKML